MLIKIKEKAYVKTQIEQCKSKQINVYCQEYNRSDKSSAEEPQLQMIEQSQTVFTSKVNYFQSQREMYCAAPREK